MFDATDLPDDVAALKAMLVAAFKQAAFGRKSEKSDPDQFDLALGHGCDPCRG